MPTNLEQVSERIRQARTVDRAGAGAGVARASDVAGRSVAGFAPGDRVLDLVSGQCGEVVHGTRENILFPAAQQPGR